MSRLSAYRAPSFKGPSKGLRNDSGATLLGAGVVLLLGRDLRDALALTALVGGEEVAPRGVLLPRLEGALVLERPAIIVVVRLAAEDERVHQRRMEEDLLEALHGAEPHQVADHRRAVVADLEAPALLRNVVAHDLDVARIPHAELVVVRH